MRLNRRGRDSNPRYGVIPYDGLANRCADSLSTDSVGTYESSDLSDTKNDTKDPALVLVVEAWADLPDHIRAAIDTLITSTFRDKSV